MKAKNRLKMISAAVLALAVLVCLAGCAGNQKKEQPSEKQTEAVSTEQSTKASEEESRVETEVQTQADTEMPTQAETEAVTQAPAPQAPHIYDVTSIAGFDTVDADGNPVSAEYLKEHRLTLVNVMSSSCGPCMEELPTLMKLSDEYTDLGFLAVNMDIDMDWNPDQTSAEIMQQLQRENGGAMKIIFPDEVLIMQVMMYTDAIPYTFFVDQEGNVVGGDYLGGRDESQWREIIEKELGA